MRIAINGATGLIGKAVIKSISEQDHEILIISRNTNRSRKVFPQIKNHIEWKRGEELIIHENIDAIINLAGENVMSKRWSEKHKKNIYDSRIITTNEIVKAVSKMLTKPKVFISASAVGYYGDSEEIVDENSKSGNDFLANVVVDWEKAATQVTEYGIRNVIIRTGIVLDKNNGALAKMIPAFKLFLGGYPGNGKQWFPWIHIDDIAGIIRSSLENTEFFGVINGVAPEIVRMKEFTKQLSFTLKRPCFFSIPKFVLILLYGEGASTILSGAHVKSNRINELGYNFKFGNLKAALSNLLVP